MPCITLPCEQTLVRPFGCVCAAAARVDNADEPGSLNEPCFTSAAAHRTYISLGVGGFPRDPHVGHGAFMSVPARGGIRPGRLCCPATATELAGYVAMHRVSCHSRTRAHTRACTCNLTHIRTRSPSPSPSPSPSASPSRPRPRPHQLTLTLTLTDPHSHSRSHSHPHRPSAALALALALTRTLTLTLTSTHPRPHLGQRCSVDFSLHELGGPRARW